MNEKERNNLNFSIALENVLIAKRLAIEWNNEKKRNFVINYNLDSCEFIANDPSLLLIWFKAIFVKLESRLEKHRVAIIQEYHQFEKLFKQIEPKYNPKLFILKEAKKMTQEERIKEYKEYERRINLIIQYFRDRQEIFKAEQKSLSEKYDFYTPKYVFTEFCTWMNEGKKKTQYYINGWSDDKMIDYKPIIDHLSLIAEKELKLIENQNKPQITETEENDGIENQGGAYKMISDLNTYQSYLDFLYKKYIISIDMKINYGYKITHNLDDIKIDVISKRIYDYIENLKRTILKADKENDINLKKECVDKYNKICDIFENQYQEYCEEKIRRGVPRHRRKENIQQEMVDTTIQEKEYDENGKLKTITSYTKKVPKSEIEKRDSSKQIETTTIESSIELPKVKNEEPEAHVLNVEKILDSSFFSSWNLLTNLINKLPYEKKFEVVNKLIAQVTEEIK